MFLWQSNKTFGSYYFSWSCGLAVLDNWGKGNRKYRLDFVEVNCCSFGTCLTVIVEVNDTAGELGSR